MRDDAETSAPSYETVPLSEWARSDPPLPLIDLRHPDSFAARRVDPKNVLRAGVVGTDTVAEEKAAAAAAAAPIVVNLHLDDLLHGEVSVELPPRDVEFAILVPREHTVWKGEHAALDDAASRFFFSTTSKVTSKSRKPWLVRQVVVEDGEMWEDAERLGLLSTTLLPRNNGTTNGERKLDFVPLPRLWRPDSLVSGALLPMLVESLEDLAAGQQQQGGLNTTLCSTGGQAVREVWDLGSGAGRDVCYLAEELKALYSAAAKRRKSARVGPVQQQRPFPLKFVGLDNHKASSRRCSPFWRNRRVDDVCEHRLVDLERVEKLHTQMSEMCNNDSPSDGRAAFGGILCLFAVRYLNRKLLRYLTSERCPFVRPGTIFAMSHFCKRERGGMWDFDQPKETNVLDRDELLRMFRESKTNWEVLKDDIILDRDHGRPLIQFLARRM